MQIRGLGLVLGVGLIVTLLAWFAGRHDARAQPAAVPVADHTELIALGGTVGDRQQVTIIDPRQRTMCVYQIGPTGEISLRSARSLRWDLMMEAYNTATPSPDELQNLFQTK
jgi:hypothetical protein